MKAKATKQRVCIDEILNTTSFALSPEELLDECKKKIPNIGIATVHREMKRLRDEGKLEEVKIANDVLRFCLKEKDHHHNHHHHFKCNDCSKVYNIDCEGLTAKLPRGFKKTNHEVTIFGTCSDCN